MAYVKTNWVNGETPINDTNLNHIENGIESVDNKNNYSTTEQVVGIYNNKPLYRKVLTGTKIQNTVLEIPTNISDINEIVRISGVLNSGENYQYPIPHYSGANDYIVVNYRKTTASFLINSANSTYMSGNVKLIIEYTKTTD